ncbi:peptidyl-prolyl cis-trans isomerase Pin1 [Thecamonas trahens ATCC 50062]|uniref:Peptidyl-prolyl cis-trans isomerase n=1 Tax=Thecamonas trahens ATCC 50062 TaxID=461836 RepID=A0A0L0DS76_THETB|nr:peptidyl-prolyl cis-trans isomerase Pin1 [Thecamonas trahens ATCC 50062]KNC54308.1 peptidyl-prolyl cis-trans isomerase Pin1 [Thecamonas trahens ATCC 50062]|eukprot:XP_013753769.1 peptidyl-prolyl cis-trans isomerase Pin1 [Thecamonas trahens ATCC 50062]
MSSSVRASHLLIKHSGSRRLASWRDPDGERIRATDKSDAIAQLKAIRERIVSGEVTFADAATELSDCSSARNGGDLGHFTRGQMQKPFEDATFALAVGDLSDVVDTDSGVHIILRTA